MLDFLKALAKRYSGDNISSKAAALAYFTIFSLGPLLFLIFGAFGQILKNEAYKAQLLEQVQAITGPEAGGAVSRIVESNYLEEKAGLALLIGIAGLLLGAIGVFGQLHRSLNDILGVKAGPDAGFGAILKRKLISLGLIGVIGFLLLVSLVVSTLISATIRNIDLGATGFLIAASDFLVSAAVFTFLLAVLYRTLPEVKLPWKVLFVASAAVALAFSAGKVILSAVVSGNATVSAFGAAGAVVALLLWIYYSGLIVYLGAAGVSLYTQAHHVKLRPRYDGEKGVLRIKEVGEPLGQPSFLIRVKRKFIDGFRRGWQK